MKTHFLPFDEKYLTDKDTSVTEEAADVKVTKVKTIKKIIKNKKGPKQEVTEITTIEKEGETPVTTVMVDEDELFEATVPIESVDSPEKTTVEEIKIPEGKPVHKIITKRKIKKKLRSRVQTTEHTIKKYIKSLRLLQNPTMTLVYLLM